MKKLLLALLLACISAGSVQAQNADPAVNITVNPGALKQDSTTIVTLFASNLGDDDIAPNSLEITVNAGSNAEITGLRMGSDPSWTVVSFTTGTNNNYVLRNTSGGIASFDGGNILLNAIGKVVSSNGVLTATVAYISGSNPNIGGLESSIQGNGQTNNDISTTTLTVTPSTPLPVQLLSFSGTAKACDAVLSWQVAEEEGTDRYELQHSADGRTFNTLRILQAEHKEGRYSVSVAQPSAKAYYRLKVAGISGEISQSSTVSVATRCAANAVTVFPNPTNGRLTITGIPAETTVNAYNTIGQQVATVMSTGANTILQLEHLPAGQYLITFTGIPDAQSVTITKTN